LAVRQTQTNLAIFIEILTFVTLQILLALYNKNYFFMSRTANMTSFAAGRRAIKFSQPSPPVSS
jgi:hypothetical protein